MTDPTRNSRLAELASVAHEFLGTYASMPGAAAVTLAHSRGIALQLNSRAGDEAAAMATWARELGATVRMVDKGGYIQCSVVTEVHGARVEIWDHMAPVPAYKLLAPLGIEATAQGVEIDPAVLLGAESTEDGA